jgi:hypothetical protein
MGTREGGTQDYLEAVAADQLSPTGITPPSQRLF